jgi:hypothetical protein
MPLPNISLIDFGAIDGKHEFSGTPNHNGNLHDAFFMPRSVSAPNILSGRTYFIRGFRGTGKTSLLRWISYKLQQDGHCGEIVLFKTDMSESKRVELSKMVGILSPPANQVELDSTQMGISQDFKEAWRWFIHKKVCEIILKNDLSQSSDILNKYSKLLGLKDAPWFERAVAGIPRFEAARIKIKKIADFVAAEFNIEIKGGRSDSVPVADVLERLDMYLAQMQLRKPIYICLDEIEVFYHTSEQYRRDLSMARDLMFASASMTEWSRQNGKRIKLYAAIRTEVLDAMGSDGQEVSRLVGDSSAAISWTVEKRSLDHALFHVLRRKIWWSEDLNGVTRSIDPIEHYFPKKINETDLEAYILDNSFYKPRDLVIRLKVAQAQGANDKSFNPSVFIKTEKEYSSSMWEEVVYELSATYTADEVMAVASLFIGEAAYFTRDDLAQRLRMKASSSKPANTILWSKGGVDVLLVKLYRIGAIGNRFKQGNSAIQRWVFRGDPQIDMTRKLALHPAFGKHLSTR